MGDVVNATLSKNNTLFRKKTILSPRRIPFYLAKKIIFVSSALPNLRFSFRLNLNYIKINMFIFSLHFLVPQERGEF